MEETKETEPKIINLSNRKFTQAEIKLLEHGLKFTPTPLPDKVDLIKDTEEFCRKLRLREFFEDYEDDDPSLLKNKSGFKPQLNRFTVRNNFLLCFNLFTLRMHL